MSKKFMARLRSFLNRKEPPEKKEAPRDLPVIKACGWKASDPISSETDTAEVILDCLHYRDEISVNLPHAPFPQHACCYSFILAGQRETEMPVPVGLLLYLWDNVPEFTGNCPYDGCGGRVYGYAFGGLLSVGGIMGVCTTCHKSVFNFVGGLAYTASFISVRVEKSPYRIKTLKFGSAFRSDGQQLLRFLKQKKRNKNGR
jgi:hypothetical protein